MLYHNVFLRVHYSLSFSSFKEKKCFSTFFVFVLFFFFFLSRINSIAEIVFLYFLLLFICRCFFSHLFSFFPSLTLLLPLS